MDEELSGYTIEQAADRLLSDWSVVKTACEKHGIGSCIGGEGDHKGQRLLDNKDLEQLKLMIADI